MRLAGGDRGPGAPPPLLDRSGGGVLSSMKRRGFRTSGALTHLWAPTRSTCPSVKAFVWQKCFFTKGIDSNENPQNATDCGTVDLHCGRGDALDCLRPGHRLPMYSTGMDKQCGLGQYRAMCCDLSVCVLWLWRHLERLCLLPSGHILQRRAEVGPRLRGLLLCSGLNAPTVQLRAGVVVSRRSRGAFRGDLRTDSLCIRLCD